MEKSIEQEELELVIMEQKSAMKRTEIEIKRMALKTKAYLESIELVKIKIAENEAKLALLKSPVSSSEVK